MLIIYTKQDFEYEHEFYLGYGNGLKLIGNKVFELTPDKDTINGIFGVKIHNPEHKGIYLKQENKFIKCEIHSGKLIPVPKEQIILDFTKTQIIKLRNKAKEKNLSLKDYLLQQINSIM